MDYCQIIGVNKKCIENISDNSLSICCLSHLIFSVEWRRMDRKCDPVDHMSHSKSADMIVGL